MKIGDYVLIRSDMTPNSMVGTDAFVEEMVPHGGKLAQIVETTIVSIGNGRTAREYLLDVDGKEYYWTKEMFCKPQETINRMGEMLKEKR